MWGIDAPESKQICRRAGGPWLCGGAAANALAEWIGTRTVLCEDKGRDRYGRMIGLCRVGGSDMSGWMVENGWAMAFVRYSRDYVAHEERAKAARRGVWASEFEAPWDWRASSRGGR
ncbi:MAG: thermonuclease family protein [Rhodospirillales bacterium]|nr:MAG: thermonuclease family protein [Rhodospirillales bacterium]